ncbi:hypothetical protein, partial [Gluconacetobacter sacchari]|uniref:hypothetical protein n=1 Tax=Gluconacetobacter sacchari TaxID=92759 RepID=UPI00223204C5
MSTVTTTPLPGVPSSPAAPAPTDSILGIVGGKTMLISVQLLLSGTATATEIATAIANATQQIDNQIAAANTAANAAQAAAINATNAASGAANAATLAVEAKIGSPGGAAALDVQGGLVLSTTSVLRVNAAGQLVVAIPLPSADPGELGWFGQMTVYYASHLERNDGAQYTFFLGIRPAGSDAAALCRHLCAATRADLGPLPIRRHTHRGQPGQHCRCAGLLRHAGGTHCHYHDRQCRDPG